MSTSILKTGACIAAVGLLASCKHLPNPSSENITSPTEQSTETEVITKWSAIPDISGIAPVSIDKYLVVHDSKNRSYGIDGPRLGLVEIDRTIKYFEKLEYTALSLSNLPEPITHDLESACKIPNQPNEFFIAESSYDGEENNLGRIIHIRLEGKIVTYLGHDTFPKDLDQFEGMACAVMQGGNILLLMGQRGGSEDYPFGAIRLGVYNPTTNTLSGLEKAISIAAPNLWDAQNLRSITGLSIDANNTLWASAAIDLDQDLGPFRSQIYTLGTVYPNADIKFVQGPVRKIWIIDGLKVEAVTNGIDGKSHSYGSEDEKLGGIWRELPKKPTLTVPYTYPVE